MKSINPHNWKSLNTQVKMKNTVRKMYVMRPLKLNSKRINVSELVNVEQHETSTNISITCILRLNKSLLKLVLIYFT